MHQRPQRSTAGVFLLITALLMLLRRMTRRTTPLGQLWMAVGSLTMLLGGNRGGGALTQQQQQQQRQQHQNQSAPATPLRHLTYDLRALLCYARLGYAAGNSTSRGGRGRQCQVH